jgi:hypothetical protein
MKKLFKNKWFKRITALIASVAIIVVAYVPLAQAWQPRDCDSNALIYCGAYSVSELNNKLNHGTGKPYQSSNQLKHLFNTQGVYQNQFDELSNGTVHKDGRVVVNGKVVHRNSHSMGRQWMPGSVRDDRFPYPVYWRPTQVSFASESIPAFVYVNYDGTMAYAIIKSCGNTVRGVGVKEKPKPKTHELTVRKYNDLNGDGVHQSNEHWLANWSFQVVGPNVNKTVRTNKEGTAVIKKLHNGTYAVTENQKVNWSSTTGLRQRVVIKNANERILFGNRKVKENEFCSIDVVKFEDVNGNGLQDEEENRIQSWSIRLNGNGVNQELLTDTNGTVSFARIPCGTYVVSEETKSGWRNITPLVQSVTVTSEEPGYIELGNQQIPETVVTTSTTVVESGETLPVSGPIEAVAGTLATIGIGTAGYMYRKSRIKLDSAFKKF